MANQQMRRRHPGDRRPAHRRSGGRHPSRRRRRRNRQRRLIPVLAAGCFILIVLCIVAVVGLVSRYSLSDERADLDSYFGLASEDEVAVVIENERLEEKGKIFDGAVYLNFETVENYLNARFYWDANENLLLYALPDRLVEATVGSSEYYVGKERKTASCNVVKTEGEQTYVSIDFVREYTDFDYQYYTEPNRLQIVNVWGDKNVVDVTGDDAVRVQAGVKSPILTEVAEGDVLTVLETEEGIEDWTKVRTDDGFIGYVRNKRIGETRTQAVSSEREFQEPVYTNISKDYTINLTWHNVTVAEANDTILSAIASTKGLTTIAPTWFRISDSEGNISSIASADYVNYAHQSGLEVWAVVDNFQEGVDTYEVLSYTSKRENLVNQLVAQAIQYDLDGINVDFEQLSAETGVHFIQFIRELSILCRSNGIVLSVDNYVPEAYTEHYYRGEQGVVADYVIIMGYDEHFAGSAESGSVASMPFVREGIEKTLAEVPAEKVINAVPFYSRLWQETPKTEEELAAEDPNADYIPYHLSSEALGMDEMESRLEANGITISGGATAEGAVIEWDDTCKQYYAEFQNNGSTYKAWLEEERSIEEKAKLIGEYGLAGIASWRLGLERASVWDIILKYVN